MQARLRRIGWRLGLVSLLAFAGVRCAPHDDAPAPAETSSDGPTPAAATKDKDVPKAAIPSTLEPRVAAALANVHNRDLLTTHGFWTIFHGILGMGPDTTLLDPKTGQKVNALDAICQGAPIRGLEFIPTPDGLDVRTMVGTGVGQGHQDQFIAEMAQWGMPLNCRFLVDGKAYTFADFVHYSKMRASTTKNQELSWAVIIVSQYYGTDHAWTNLSKEALTCEDLVRYELNQPVDTAACGGTHRLFGLTWALHLHQKKGGRVEGVWKEVADKLEVYKQRAHQFQNPDGSFSTAYLAKPGNNPELQARIGATGHVLEWLALAMTDKELRQDWVGDAASALAVMILQNQNNPIDGGALYHATHGLHIYRARVFGTPGPRGLLFP
jgi:hypothetical protein